ncbi:MAG: YIP1 family protein [Candidatus Paceibacterota bacterium]
MKNFKFFDILPILLVMLGFCFVFNLFSQESLVIKKAIKTEIKRVYKGNKVFVRFITHYEEDSSACVPASPECDLYRTKKLGFKEYLLDTSAVKVPDSFILGLYFLKNNLYKKEYLRIYFKKDDFWTQHVEFEEKRLLKKDNLLYLDTKIITESGFSYVYLFSLFVVLYICTRIYLVGKESKKAMNISAWSFFIFLIICTGIFLHLYLDSEKTNDLFSAGTWLFLIILFLALVLDGLPESYHFEKFKKTLVIWSIVLVCIFILISLVISLTHIIMIIPSIFICIKGWVKYSKM